MTEDGYFYLDMDRVNEDIETGKAPIIYDDPEVVLYGTILDLLKLAYNEGMTDEEIDDVLRRVMDFRAGQIRGKFRLHTSDDK